MDKTAEAAQYDATRKGLGLPPRWGKDKELCAVIYSNTETGNMNLKQSLTWMRRRSIRKQNTLFQAAAPNRGCLLHSSCTMDLLRRRRSQQRRVSHTHTHTHAQAHTPHTHRHRHRHRHMHTRITWGEWWRDLLVKWYNHFYCKA